jgi:hypothetical protein
MKTVNGYTQYVPASDTINTIQLPAPMTIEKVATMIAGLNGDVRTYGCIYYLTPKNINVDTAK